jgi:hypothetical protein
MKINKLGRLLSLFLILLMTMCVSTKNKTRYEFVDYKENEVINNDTLIIKKYFYYKKAI